LALRPRLVDGQVWTDLAMANLDYPGPFVAAIVFAYHIDDHSK
jgi:hypothetical protein